MGTQGLEGSRDETQRVSLESLMVLSAVASAGSITRRLKSGRSSSCTTCANASPTTTTSMPGNMRRIMGHTALEAANRNLHT